VPVLMTLGSGSHQGGMLSATGVLRPVLLWTHWKYCTNLSCQYRILI